jgi:ribonuclease E
MPKFENLVKLHQEKRPIFSRYQLEEQIDQIYEKKVLLKSGGSLVIEPTEALVSIDVNSGKSTGERGVEDTAFKTNMEAAEEAARQLRLRDLGGLIVIDFIDMRDKKHMSEVEKTLKLALKADKARVTVGKISQFGMLEMSRQRIKQTLEQGSVLACPHCEGRGKVKSVENMAISFLRKVYAAAAKGTVSEVRGALPLDVAYYLLNRKKRELVRIEGDYEIEITIKGKPSFLMNQMELDLLRREKPLHLEIAHEETVEMLSEPAEQAPQDEEKHEAPVATVEGTEAKKKKRRKRKKVKVEGEPLPGGESAAIAQEQPTWETVAEAEGEGALPVTDVDEADEADEAGTATDTKPAEHKKKRRRRRRRGKGGAAEGVAVSEVGEERESALPEPLVLEPFVQETVVPETVVPDEAASVNSAEKPRKKRAPRKKKEPADELPADIPQTDD